MNLANIGVIGVGGCGCNNVRLLAQQELSGRAKLLALNTDIINADKDGIQYIQLGSVTTKGLGAGALPDVGEAAARENETELKPLLADYDLVILTAGLGGGTGSGALPVVAQLLADLAIPSITLVTMPFEFEGKKRTKHALTALNKISAVSNAIQVIENQKLKQTLGGKTSLLDCFAFSNQANLDCLTGLLDIIDDTGLINLDLSDVKQVLAIPAYTNIGKLTLTKSQLSNLKSDDLVNPLSPYPFIARCHSALIQVKAGCQFELTDLETIGGVFQNHISESALIVLGFKQQETEKSGNIEIFYLLNGVLPEDNRQDIVVNKHMVLI